MNVLAVDVGFGITKHCRGTGARGQVGLFPSLAVPSTAGRFEGLDHNAEGLVPVLVDEARYLVGPQILQWLPGYSERIMDPTFSMTTTYLALLRGALTLARHDNPSLDRLDLLVVGLPLDTFSGMSAGLRKRLTGVHPLIGSNGCIGEIEVADVLVLPQPFGALFGVLSNRTARASRDTTYLVIDVGFGMLDWYTSVGTSAMLPRCGGAPFGVGQLLRAGARSLLPGSEAQPEVLQRIDLALREGDDTVRLEGRERPLCVAQSAMAGLLDSGLASILGGVGRHATIDHVVVVGGGARFYVERLADVFGDRLEVMNDVVFANVRGFSAYGALHARRARRG
jgi:PRTRC genetic system protein D